MPPLLTLPAVDGVEITTIMDNSFDALMSSTAVAHRFPTQQDFFTREQLRAEHGTSFLITVINQGRRDTILFDTGVSPDGALHNLDIMDIDLTSVQAIVLSHGHTDHTHGMDGFLERLGRRRMPILLHPDAFLKRRLVYNDDKILDLPPPSLHDLSHEGIELLVERGPSFLVNGTLLVTGQIERTTDFEQGIKNQQAEVDGSWLPDPWVYDDQAIVIHVRDKGLVVITGCGHAGVVNILRQARAQTGVEQIYAGNGRLPPERGHVRADYPTDDYRVARHRPGGDRSSTLHRLARCAWHRASHARGVRAEQCRHDLCSDDRVVRGELERRHDRDTTQSHGRV